MAKDLERDWGCWCKNTALTSKGVRVMLELNVSNQGLGTDVGYPKFYVPTWKQFHEVFTVTEQRQRSKHFSNTLVETLSRKAQQSREIFTIGLSDAVW